MEKKLKERNLQDPYLYYEQINQKRQKSPLQKEPKLSSLENFTQQLRKEKKQTSSLPPLTTRNKNETLRKIQNDVLRIKQNLKRQLQRGQSTTYQHNYASHSPFFLPMQIPAYQQQHQPQQQPPPQLPYQMPMPMPFPIPIPFPMNSYPYPYQEQCPKRKKRRRRAKKRQEEEIIPEPKPEVKPVPKPPKKPMRKDLRKRFRICVYAVYFCIFFKYYSKRFTEIRRNWFNDRYHKKNAKIIFKGSEKVLQELMKIDLQAILKQAEKQSKQKQGQEYVHSATSIVASLNPETRKIILSINTLLDKISELLETQEFMDQYHEVFTAGSLNQSFMITNLYLPQELHYLYIHPIKGYLQITPHEEIELLLIRVFIKMIVYNYLFGVKKSPGWQARAQKNHSLDSDELSALIETARFIGLFLYAITKEMYFTGLKIVNRKSNFIECGKKFGIKAAKHLEDTGPEEKKKNNNLELIKNLEGIENVEQKIKKNHALRQFKEVVKSRIVDILVNLHERLKTEEQQVYKYIKQLTLQQSYLILSAKNKQYYDQKHEEPLTKTKRNRLEVAKNTAKYLLNNYQYSSPSKDQSSRSRQVKIQEIMNESQILQQYPTEEDKQNESVRNLLKTSLAQNLKTQEGNRMTEMSEKEERKQRDGNQSNLFGSKVSKISSKQGTRYGAQRIQNLRYKLKKIVAKQN